MKKLLLTLLIGSASLAVNSQYYYFQDSTGLNPGNLNTETEYPFASGSGWTSILGASNSSAAWSSVATIPFSFSFNGGAVTKFKVSSSGVLTFKTTATTIPGYVTSVTLPSATVPDSSVCVLGIDGKGTNDNIITKTFGTAPNRQHWVSFSSYSAGTDWTYWSIVLEETTNKIYVVDQRHGNTISGISIGIQVNSLTAYSVTGSPTLTGRAGANASAADNVFYEFIPGTQPAYDLIAKNNTTAKYKAIGNAPFTLSGNFQNRGTTTLTSYDLNYKVGAGATVTSNVTGVSLATLATTNASHPTTWTPAAIGTYNVKMWTSNINGNADIVPVNDTMDFVIIVLDTFVPRKTLLEVFTSSTCGPCVPGNINMDNVVLPVISNYTVIKYQQNFPGSGDPYSTATSVARRGFYGINSIPRMEIDGGWDVNASSFSKTVFNSFQEKPSYMTINITSARHYDGKVNVAADITPIKDFTGNIKYHVVITEKETTLNTGSNGETEFFNVMMNMSPDETGNTMTALTSGSVTNISLNSNLAGTNVEDSSDLKVVVFVQNMTTKEVYQSEWMDVSNTYASVNEIDKDKIKMSLFPNPSNGMVTLNYKKANNSKATITVVNLLGKVVYEANGENGAGDFSKQLDLSNLSKGVYMVNVISNNIKSTKKLVIQ